MATTSTPLCRISVGGSGGTLAVAVQALLKRATSNIIARTRAADLLQGAIVQRLCRRTAPEEQAQAGNREMTKRRGARL